MTGQVTQLTLRVEPDSDVVDLREVLLELNIDSADPLTRGPAPPGTRAGEMLVAGALMVMLTRSKDLLTEFVKRVQWWVSLCAGRRVRLELDGDVLEVTGLPWEVQRELIQLFIDRHTDG